MRDLRDYFTGVAWKRLTEVEANPSSSNQHELNGVAVLKTILGEPIGTLRFPTRFHYIPDDGQDAVTAEGFASWYDAREKHPTRSEYRLYYPGNEIADHMNPGDLVVLARRDNQLFWFVAPAGSTAESQLMWLFSLEDRDGDGQLRMHAKPVEPPGGRSWFSVRRAIEALGIEPGSEAENSVVAASEPWGDLPIDRWVRDGLPTTAAFSTLTRTTLGDFEELARSNPDDALARAMEREEEVFVEWERRLLGDRVERGFNSVEEFLSFSMSVQNRRKSRAGHAFEHHIAAVLAARDVRFERNTTTENNSRPDFLMPGATNYHDPGFPAEALDLLGAKTTCKDRWRQVLSEARRIKRKHLVTLEPAISEAQTGEMRSHGLQLVLPKELHASFRRNQRGWLMSVEDFCAMRREKDEYGRPDVFI